MSTRLMRDDVLIYVCSVCIKGGLFQCLYV